MEAEKVRKYGYDVERWKKEEDLAKRNVEIWV
jgi:hypothetical protein